MILASASAFQIIAGYGFHRQGEAAFLVDLHGAHADHVAGVQALVDFMADFSRRNG